MALAVRHALSAWMVVNPRAPKLITLTAHVARWFDSDGLQSALAACRDGLQDAGLIVTDGPDQGHTWTYDQVIDGRRGVTIRVQLG